MRLDHRVHNVLEVPVSDDDTVETLEWLVEAIDTVINACSDEQRWYRHQISQRVWRGTSVWDYRQELAQIRGWVSDLHVKRGEVTDILEPLRALGRL